MMSAIEPSPSDKKHVRSAWIWAAVIIAVGMLTAVGGLLPQVENQGAAEAGMYGP